MTEAGRLKLVRRVEDIPDFVSEDEEDRFWSTHALSDELWEKAKPIPSGLLPKPRPRTRSIAIRFDETVLRRAKGLAAQRNTGYQTLLKEFILERLYEEEKREGFVGAAAATIGRPADSDLTATAANEGVRRRTISRGRKGSLYTRRTSANVGGRKKPGL